MLQEFCAVSNKDVDDNFEGVCRMIDKVINERIENLP